MRRDLRRFLVFFGALALLYGLGRIFDYDPTNLFTHAFVASLLITFLVVELILPRLGR